MRISWSVFALAAIQVMSNDRTLEASDMVRCSQMRGVDITPDQLARALTDSGPGTCILDSCGVDHAGPNLLIAGIEPVRTARLTGPDPAQILSQFEDLLSNDNLAAIFTISYGLGLAINGIPDHSSSGEPVIFAALFDTLAVHDYKSGQAQIAGDEAVCRGLKERLIRHSDPTVPLTETGSFGAAYTSNFSRDEYIAAVESVKELIRDGETYQANLTQQLTVPLAQGLHPRDVFLALRHDHPAAFAAYIERGDSTVVSASPELFFRVDHRGGHRAITASPIKGTRRRGSTETEDRLLRHELRTSAKDRAENAMIVDLMRNDLGRVCEFGTVEVKALCRLEEHPTLFHLVSTVEGDLRERISTSDILRAVFPCGSITGAPKIRTMEILEELETHPRGLSMGAIGCRIPGGRFGTEEIFEMSVAIRTMVVTNGIATFNVGGGIVIDSDPASEYDESMLKAKALLRVLGAQPDGVDLAATASGPSPAISG